MYQLTLEITIGSLANLLIWSIFPKSMSMESFTLELFWLIPLNSSSLRLFNSSFTFRVLSKNYCLAFK